MATPQIITPPSSPKKIVKDGVSSCPEKRLPRLRDCHGLKMMPSVTCKWHCGDYLTKLISLSTGDMNELLRSISVELAVFPSRCSSLEILKCRLNQVLLAISDLEDSQEDLEILEIDFNNYLTSFLLHLTECYRKCHFDEVSNAIHSVLRFAGPLSNSALFQNAQAKSLKIIHIHLDLRYYFLVFFLWTDCSAKCKDNVSWDGLDHFVLHVLQEALEVSITSSENSCICFEEFRAVFLYYITKSSSATDLFFQWAKSKYSSEKLAEMLFYFSSIYFPVFPDLKVFEVQSNINLQSFYSKCLKTIQSTCFSSNSATGTCLATAMEAVACIFKVTTSVDEFFLRSLWDYFASNMNKFWVPKTIQDMFISTTNECGADVISHFRTIVETKNSTFAEDMSVFPLAYFVNFFTQVFGNDYLLPTVNDKKRCWRKIKGGLFKRFYEANLRRLNEDGWINAGYMLMATGYVASSLASSEEDLALIGEILQRVPFGNICEIGQITVLTCLFTLTKINHSWSEEFHPSACLRNYMIQSFDKSTPKSNTVILRYLHGIEAVLETILDEEKISQESLNSFIVELCNLPNLGKFVQAETLAHSNLNVEFIHQLMEMVGAILLLGRQLVLATGDSQGNSSLDDNLNTLVANGNSPLCRLIVHMNTSFYPLVKLCESAIQKSCDVSISKFVTMLRGFLLLGFDVAHLPIPQSGLVQPQELISSYAQSNSSSPKMAIIFLADCLQNSRITSQLNLLKIFTPDQYLTFYFRLSMRLLVCVESSRNQSGLFPDMSTYCQFQRACYRLGNLETNAIPTSPTASSLSPATLVDALTTFLASVGQNCIVLSDSFAPILEPFLTASEECLKMGPLDSLSQGLVKALYRLAGSLFCYCISALYKPFRPDCLLSKAILLYFQRIVSARKTLPPSYAISILHKWTIPGILIGIGRLMQNQVDLAEDANLKRYVNDCVVESLVKGQSRPAYSFQSLAMHPLVASGILGTANQNTKLEPSLKPIGENENCGSIQKIVVSKLISDCLDSKFPNWNLAGSLLEFYLENGKITASLMATALTRLLDLFCTFEESRYEVAGYAQSIDQLFCSVSKSMSKHELWENSEILQGIGNFVDQTATAHPKSTFSSLSRFLVATIRSRPENLIIQPFVMAVRAAVVRMELDYGNADFVRPHFETFENQFQRYL